LIAIKEGMPNGIPSLMALMVDLGSLFDSWREDWGELSFLRGVDVFILFLVVEQNLHQFLGTLMK